MLSRLFKPKYPINNFHLRNYWVPPTEPTHDIVATIKECRKWQLSFLVKKKYNNHFSGGNINIEPKELLNCTQFFQIKQILESEKFIVNVWKDKSLGTNTFGVRYDEFTKKLDVYI